MPMCTSTQYIQEATAQDANLQGLKVYSIHRWPHKKMMWHKTYRNIGLSDMSHDWAMIDGVAVKSKRLITPSQLQMQLLSQLHSNHV